MVQWQLCFLLNKKSSFIPSWNVLKLAEPEKGQGRLMKIEKMRRGSRPGLPGSIRVDTTVTDDHRQTKKLTAYKYPLTFPKWWPSLVLMSNSSHIPILIACSILCLVIPHHCPTCTIIHRFLISPSVPVSPGICFSLSLSIQSWWNQPKFIHHPKLSPTISYHPLCMWNYPLTTPSFPL